MATRYDTGNQVPSNTMMDLSDNVQVLDSFINNPEGTVPLRTGEVVPVLQAQLAERIDGLTSIAQEAIDTSTANAAVVASDKSTVQSLTDTTTLVAAAVGVFTITTEDPDGTIAGLAATTDGQSFYVAQGTGASTAAILYKNVSGAAVAVAKLSGQAAVDAVASSVSSGLRATNNNVTATNLTNSVQIGNQSKHIKHVFNTLQLNGITAAVAAQFCPERSALIINSLVNSNAVGVPGGITVKVAGTTVYQPAILPGESVSAGVKTSPYAYKDITGAVPAQISYDTSIVRVRYAFTMINQTLAIGGYNVQDKNNVFSPTTQTAASTVTVRSVSSHSAGGIQLAIPNALITGAGFTLDDSGVKSYIATFSALVFWCLTSSVQSTENFVDYAVVDAGAFSLDVTTGVTFNASLYSSRIPTAENGLDDLSKKSSFDGYSNKVFSGDLAEASGLIVSDSAALFLTELSTNGTLANVNGITVLKDGTEISRRYFPGASTLSGNTLSSLYKPFRFRDLAVETLASAAAGMLRIRYYLPAGFGGLAYDYTVPVCVDICGLFYPTIANNAATTTQRAVSGHADNNKVQFMLTTAELTALGYDATDKYSVDRYLKTLAADCQFVAYTGTNQSVTLDSHLLAIAMPAGAYSFSYLSSGGLKGSIRRQPVSAPVDTGAYIRSVADIVNSTSQAHSNYPFEIRSSFNPGQVASSDCLVLTDSDGNEHPCQWADEFHCNPRQQSNMGFHYENSLRDGSVFFMDSLAAGAKKYYELRAYNRPMRSYVSPALTRNGRDFSVSVDGWVYNFTGSNQYQLRSIIDPTGTTHNITAILYISGLVSGTSSEVAFDNKPTLRMVNTGPVFTEVETVVFNSAFAGIAAGALKARIRTRMFKNGKCKIYTMVTAVTQIATGLLYGVSMRCNLSDAAYAYDNNVLTAAWADSTSNQNWSSILIRANGDVHRDGTTYGPLRPVRATFINPTTTSVRAYAGWVYTSATDYSFLNWPVTMGWTWTNEFWIDGNNSLTDKTAIASQVHNRPIGYAGNSPFVAVSRQDALDTMARHVRGSMAWWNSADASAYGGGTATTLLYHSYTADIMNLLAYGRGDFATIYSNFKTYIATRWGTLATIGAAYTSGSMVLQFASRLSIPVLQWLYYLAVKNNDAAKIAELQAGIKSLADALVTKFNALGGVGIPLNGSASDTGNSNSNAAAMRALALAIYAGQDSAGAYLATLTALESIITSRSSYMRIEGIVTDTSSDVLAGAMYLHYQAYAVNNYLFAEKMAGRTPAFDLVNYIMLATSGMGGFKEIDYCISESRRGSANTITFAAFSLLLAGTTSTVNAANTLLSKLKSEYGPRPGFPLRFFGFDGTTANGTTISDISFVATTLSDIWLYYYFSDN